MPLHPSLPRAMAAASIVLGALACKTTGQSESAVKIVEGDKVEASDRVSQSVVLIKTSTGVNAFGRCSGTLLANGFVLSAAHCFQASKQVLVVFGSGSRPKEEQIELPGVATIHPRYSPFRAVHRQYASNDIAVVKIDKAMVPSYMASLEVGKPDDFKEGDDVIIAGYGSIRQLSAEPPAELKEQMMASNPNAANDLYRAQTTIDRIDVEKKRIFFRSKNNLSSSCYGDSGGPMLIEKNGNLVVIGVTNSANLDDADSMRYCKGTGTYANATLHADWLDIVLAGVGEGGTPSP